jgi:hypothetical protein
VPLLLAARDAQLVAEEEEASVAVAETEAAVAATAAAAAEPAAAEPALQRPSCAICMEPYSAAAGVVPRMRPSGHAFCEACLAQMLRCAGTTRASPQRLSLVAGRLCTITTGPGWWAERERRQFCPELGPTSASSSCFPTATHGPAASFGPT